MSDSQSLDLNESQVIEDRTRSFGSVNGTSSRLTRGVSSLQSSQTSNSVLSLDDSSDEEVHVSSQVNYGKRDSQATAVYANPSQGTTMTVTPIHISDEPIMSTATSGDSGKTTGSSPGKSQPSVDRSQSGESQGSTVSPPRPSQTTLSQQQQQQQQQQASQQQSLFPSQPALSQSQATSQPPLPQSPQVSASQTPSSSQQPAAVQRPPLSSGLSQVSSDSSSIGKGGSTAEGYLLNTNSMPPDVFLRQRAILVKYMRILNLQKDDIIKGGSDTQRAQMQKVIRERNNFLTPENRELIELFMPGQPIPSLSTTGISPMEVKLHEEIINKPEGLLQVQYFIQLDFIKGTWVALRRKHLYPLEPKFCELPKSPIPLATNPLIPISSARSRTLSGTAAANTTSTIMAPPLPSPSSSLQTTTTPTMSRVPPSPSSVPPLTTATVTQQRTAAVAKGEWINPKELADSQHGEVGAKRKLAASNEPNQKPKS